MARLNPRRLASKARQDKAAIIAANLASPKPRSGKLDVVSARIEPRGSVMLANANSAPPQGAVFTARVERPWLRPKRFKRFAKG